MKWKDISYQPPSHHFRENTILFKWSLPLFYRNNVKMMICIWGWRLRNLIELSFYSGKSCRKISEKWLNFIIFDATLYYSIYSTLLPWTHIIIRNNTWKHQISFLFFNSPLRTLWNTKLTPPMTSMPITANAIIFVPTILLIMELNRRSYYKFYDRVDRLTVWF